MAFRLQAFGRALRTALAEQHQGQIRRHSVFSEFKKKVQEEVESNPSVKKSMDELKQTADSLRERTKSATEGLQKAASASAQATRAASQQVKGTVEDLTNSAQKEEGTTSPSGAGTNADTAAGETSGKEQAQGTPTEDRQKSESAIPGTDEGPSGAQGQEHSGGAAGSQTAGAAGSTGSLMSRLRSAAEVVRREVAAAILPEAPVSSATRAYSEELRGRAPPPTSESAVAVVPPTRWQRQWDEWQNKLGGHPLFKRVASLREHKVFSKGKEVADDLRERWETSDSPLVHRIQDMTETVFEETEVAKTVREIRARDPNFDMVRFLRNLKQDIQPVIQAYLKADEVVLSQHCTPGCVQRLSGIIKAEVIDEDKYPDTNLLDISDVELHDLQMFEDNPVVVVKCFRDKFDNVVEGSPDDVHRVLYVWALQQGTAGFVGADGRLHPPQWQIGEMAVGVAQKLL
ncbi:Tim44-domain-containing protein [Coccomyxa subellipsoidea C-169]|uniref:Tim44-domain-containing protein n=1 Tax=Coccomyxa subellipsoidea (strain C-169) TaxID=574566 RepID=I0Z1J5_COCSC|nr:Tim44-domain-containing protein [Coccomyxa subellipsoidea C-169]EIE24514.1 Tim44-domain-containing protein [Coccomyxa subellipsoidea C-169]|eukprot:XP_005649058.1 Tim44-domain-containing protein [Coccomyxa subellipsoidea C-169]